MSKYNKNFPVVKQDSKPARIIVGNSIDLSYSSNHPAGWLNDMLFYNADLGSALVHSFDFYRCNSKHYDCEHVLAWSLDSAKNSPPPRWAKPAEKRVLRLARDCTGDITLIGSKNDSSGSNDLVWRRVSCGDRLCPICSAYASKADYEDLRDVALQLQKEHPELAFVTVLLTCKNFYPYYAAPGLDVFKTAVQLLRDSSKMSSKVSKLFQHNFCDFEFTINSSLKDDGLYFGTINFHAHLLCAVPKSYIFRNDRIDSESYVTQKLLREEFCRALRLACSKCSRHPHGVPTSYVSWLDDAFKNISALSDPFAGLDAYAPERNIGKDSSGKDWVKVNIQRAYTPAAVPDGWQGDIFTRDDGSTFIKDFSNISGAISEVTKYMTKGYDDTKGLGAIVHCKKLPSKAYVSEAYISHMVSRGYSRTKAGRYGVAYCLYLCLQSMLYRRQLLSTSGYFAELASPEDFQSVDAPSIDFWSDDLFAIRAVKCSFATAGHEIVRSADNNVARSLLVSDWYQRFYYLSGGCTLLPFKDFGVALNDFDFPRERCVFPFFDNTEYSKWLIWYQENFCTDYDSDFDFDPDGKMQSLHYKKMPRGSILSPRCAGSRWKSYQKLQDLARILCYLKKELDRCVLDDFYKPLPYKMPRWLVRRFYAPSIIGYSRMYVSVYDNSRSLIPSDWYDYQSDSALSFEKPLIRYVNDFIYE